SPPRTLRPLDTPTNYHRLGDLLAIQCADHRIRWNIIPRCPAAQTLTPMRNRNPHPSPTKLKGLQPATLHTSNRQSRTRFARPPRIRKALAARRRPHQGKKTTSAPTKFWCALMTYTDRSHHHADARPGRY